MSDKPSYLGLLNAVSLAESNAHCYLSEWASVTKDPDVRRVLLTVAAREGEHGMTFAKRINELGYELLQRPDENLEKNLEIVRSDCSDLEKMEALGSAGVPIPRTSLMSSTISSRTTPSTSRPVKCWAATSPRNGTPDACSALATSACATPRTLRRPANGASKQDSKAAKATAKRLTAIEAKVDQLCAAVEDLGKVVRSETVAS